MSGSDTNESAVQPPANIFLPFFYQLMGIRIAHMRTKSIASFAPLGIALVQYVLYSGGRRATDNFLLSQRLHALCFPYQRAPLHVSRHFLTLEKSSLRTEIGWLTIQHEHLWFYVSGNTPSSKYLMLLE